ncbi:MAG: LacI family DNA-binding transcriptional regulator [Acidimicrobiia bacterium]
MKSHRTTIKDVGRRAGVSVATVSKALNGTGIVSNETQKKVVEAAESLGYSPSKAAQGLVGGRSFQVGYGLPEPGERGNPTLNAFLHSMVDAASGHGLEIVLFRDLAYDTSPYEGLVRSGVVDGFVLSETDYDDGRVDYLLERGIPFVTFGRTAGSDRHFWVDVDGEAGMMDVSRHLIERGHSRFGVIGWPDGSESGDLRLDGIFKVLADHGFPQPTTVRTTNGFESGRVALAQLLEIDPSITAVIAVEDELALGAMTEAAVRGIEVGKQLAVAGFDDIPMASIVQPGLTSVRQPFKEIGAVLVDLLADALSLTHEPRGVLLKPHLVIRPSTGGSM